MSWRRIVEVPGRERQIFRMRPSPAAAQTHRREDAHCARNSGYGNLGVEVNQGTGLYKWFEREGSVLEWRWASVLQARSDRVDFWLGKALAACYGVNLAGARFWGVGLLGCWSRPVVVPLPWPREKPGPLNTASHLTVRRGCEGRGSGVQPKAPRGGPIGARRVVLGALARHTIERQPGAGSRKPGAERQEPGAGSR